MFENANEIPSWNLKPGITNALSFKSCMLGVKGLYPISSKYIHFHTIKQWFYINDSINPPTSNAALKLSRIGAIFATVGCIALQSDIRGPYRAAVHNYS